MWDRIATMRQECCGGDLTPHEIRDKTIAIAEKFGFFEAELIARGIVQDERPHGENPAALKGARRA